MPEGMVINMERTGTYSKQVKALVVAEIPAPYRVDVFLEMSKGVKLDVYFNSCKDQSRSPDYFVKSDSLTFEILDNEVSKKHFRNALKHLDRYDFVMAYHPTCVPALIVETLCRIKNIPYYINIDGAFINPNFIRDSIKRFVYRGARGCFSGGDSATQYLLHYGVKKERIFEYGFTVLHEEDIEPAPVTMERKLQIRRELNLPERKMVLSIGQFIPRKGFDVLLQAWKEAGVDGAQLVIIGGGPERANYERFIRENGLKDIILIDFLPKEKIKEYYLAADLFVLSTREDIWGLVVNEAMANGLPVITTEMCNAGVQLIENGVNGYIVPVEDIKSLAKRIVDALETADNMVAEVCLQTIKSYTIENAAKNHIDAIEKTLNTKQASL